MLARITKIIILSLLFLVVLHTTIAKDDNKEEELVQTCSKDDQICQKAAKAKESLESAPKTSAANADANTSDETMSGERDKTKEKLDPKDESKAQKKATKKSSTKKKSKSKSVSDVTDDCPLCSYTRPLIKRIMEWIRELLSDPMMIMVFEFVKEKVWQLGKMTKQLFGFQLF